MKYASLSFLSLQTASHVVATRYSRATNRDSPYLPSTVVALVEIFKMLITLSMLFAEKGELSPNYFYLTHCLYMFHVFNIHSKS